MQQILTADQRLVLLRTLQETGFDANESILSSGLEMYGHRISRDLVRNHLNWLEEQGLVRIERLANGYMVATITARGADVAEGRVVVDGVKRPRPR